MLPRIGMRNIKTALSVFLCLLIFRAIQRENSFYACIAAVICMQPTLDNTFKKGLSRIIGTAIGGVVGIILLVISEIYVSESAFIFLIPIGIVILIEICIVIDQRDSVSICCVVYLGIMIMHRYQGDYFWYTLNRVIDTSIGIIIAAVVNRYLKVPEIFIKGKKSNESQDNIDIIDNLNSSDNIGNIGNADNLVDDNNNFNKD